MRTSDGYIVNQCLNGDSAAFGLLVAKYKEAIYALAYSKLRNFHDAEDVTQEVFIKAYQKLRTLRRWDDLQAWLYAITSNLCKMWIRTRSRRPDREFIEDQAPGVSKDFSTDSYHDSPVLDSLDEALDSLPETYRQVLTLHYLGGMSCNEIARFLGLSPTTIWQRLSRARAQLKEDMLAMMNTAFEERRLPAGFTFRIVESVKQIRIHPVPRITALPWGLSLATGIIFTILSLGSHMSVINPMYTAASSAIPSEMGVMEVGEVPVDVLRISQIPFISGSQGSDDGRKSGLSSQQNAALMAPGGEGGKFPEKPSAQLGKGYVYQTVYSPDGKLFAVATQCGVWLYDAENLSEVGLLECSARSVAFSPDGKMLASGSGDIDGMIRLWDVQGKNQIGLLAGHTADSVCSVAYSPDGKILASGGGQQDKTVRLWDVRGQKQIGILRGHAGAVTSLAFSSDGKILASGSGREGGKDRPIFLWDIAEQKQAGLLQGHTDEAVKSLAFSLDGKLLASGSWNAARLWNVQEQKQVAMLQGAACHVFSDPDGRLLIIMFKGNAIRLWDIQEEKQLGILHEPLILEDFPILSPDGKILALRNPDAGIIQFWDVVGQKQAGWLRGYTLGVQSIAFSPDGKILASHDSYKTISLWDVQGQRQLAMLREDREETGGFQFVVFSPDGKILASGGNYNNEIRLWDVQGQKQIGLLKGHTDGIWSLAFSPDGKILASGGGRQGDSTVRLWDVKEQKEVKVLRGHSAHVHSLAFSPDGELLASGAGIDNTVRLWDTQGWNLIDVLPHDQAIMSIAFSPDSKTLATGDYGGTVRFWDLHGAPKLLIALGGHTQFVRSLSFSPDGKWLASGSFDGTVRIWDAAEQAEVAVLKEHIYSVYSVAFSPDGRWFASGGGDSKILLWEVNIPVQGKAVESTGKLPGTWGEVKRTELLQNFPNPFNPETWVPFNLPNSEHVIIKIYSSKGELVKTLDLGQKPPGAYLSKEKAAYWDGRNENGEPVASDVYFYAIQTGEATGLRKMVMAR